MQSKKYKRMSHEKFNESIEQICDNLSRYIEENNIKIDYICPILRSGAVPAVYIANRLNIVKFLPIQVKHIAYKNGDNKIDIIFNPFDSIEIKKKEPVILVVDAMQSTGSSIRICMDEIRNRCKDAKLLYVCLFKEYGSRDFKDITIYEDSISCYNGKNKFSEEECEKLNIEYFRPLFPWEVLEIEMEHPDDLEENIFF